MSNSEGFENEEFQFQNDNRYLATMGDFPNCINLCIFSDLKKMIESQSIFQKNKSII